MVENSGSRLCGLGKLLYCLTYLCFTSTISKSLTYTRVCKLFFFLVLEADRDKIFTSVTEGKTLENPTNHLRERERERECVC